MQIENNIHKNLKISILHYWHENRYKFGIPTRL